MGRIIVDGQQVSDAIDTAQGIAVSKDGGAATAKRPLIDVTDSGPVVVSVTDDGGNNKVVIDVDASAALDATAHAAIDHSTITGSGGGTRFFTTTATTADIQAALNDASVHTVFLDRGTFTLSATLVIPIGKSLIGMNAMDMDTINGSYATRLLWSTAMNPVINIQDGGRLAFIQLDDNVGSSGAYSATDVAIRIAGSAATTAVLDHVKVDGYGAGAIAKPRAAFSIEADSARLTHCAALHCVAVGFRIVAGNDRTPVLLNNCFAYNCNGTSNEHGFEMGGTFAVQLIDCISQQNAGHGFSLIPGGGMRVIRCRSYSNTGSGFFTGTNTTTDMDMIVSCTARSNGQWGFDYDGNGSGTRGRFHDNLGTGNTNPGFNNFTAAGGGWISYDNWAV